MKRSPLNRLGKRGRENQKINREKKREHLKSGILSCELRISEYCTPFDNLSWSHSRKRRLMGKFGSPERAANMRESVLACLFCHRLCDEGMNHAEMLEIHKRVIANRDTEITI